MAKSRGKDMKAVSYDQRFKQLQKEASSPESEDLVRRIPAVKLLDFFRGLPTDLESTPVSTEKRLKVKHCATVGQ